MGIAKFETGGLETQGTTQNTGGGSSKMLFIIIGLGIAAYLGYKYVYLPSKQKKQENDDRQNPE